MEAIIEANLNIDFEIAFVLENFDKGVCKFVDSWTNRWVLIENFQVGMNF